MKALGKSFLYAWQGLRYALRHERNLRIHLMCMLYMYLFLGLFDFFQLSRVEYALLFLANALVLMGELINTAIESTINLMVKKYNRFAKAAKDTAAAAVLVAALFAIAVGIALLWQPEAFRQLFLYFKEHSFALIAFVVSLILGVLYVLHEPEKKDHA